MAGTLQRRSIVDPEHFAYGSYWITFFFVGVFAFLGILQVLGLRWGLQLGIPVVFVGHLVSCLVRVKVPHIDKLASYYTYERLLNGRFTRTQRYYMR